MRSLLVLVLALLVAPAAASAQFDGMGCPSSTHENPIGIAVGLSSGLAPLLALPVLGTEGAIPRPGSASWTVGLGYQSSPDSFALTSSAGAYFRGAPALGLESRVASRVMCSGLDLAADAAYLLLLRPTPIEWPVWIELLAGASASSAFGDHTSAYLDGGPAGGARGGFRLELPEAMRLVIEGEALYGARVGTSYAGALHELELAARVALMFAMPEGGRAGVAIEYRHEHPFAPHPTLPETHRITAGGSFAF